MGGAGIGPLTLEQTLFASFGVFMAAYINANIFGELGIILSNFGKDEQRFQILQSQVNTCMINLNLP